MQELNVKRRATTKAGFDEEVGDILVQHLKVFFGTKNENDIDLDMLREKATCSILGTEGAPATISNETLKKVAEAGQVETFCLVNAVESNNYTGVNIYLDEVGMLKRLPLNSRAINFALRAGYNPPPNFYGDVFLGRVKIKPFLGNINFKLGIDTAPDAPWLQKGMHENLNHQIRLNKLTAGQIDTQPLQPTNDGEDGVEKKEEEGYSWSQTDEEIEIQVPLLLSATKKNVQVIFKRNSTLITVRIEEEEHNYHIKLYASIDIDSCTWTLDNSSLKKKVLVITMEKSEQLSWPRIKF